MFLMNIFTKARGIEIIRAIINEYFIEGLKNEINALRVIAIAIATTRKNHKRRNISALKLIRTSIRITPKTIAIIMETRLTLGVMSFGGSIHSGRVPCEYEL